MDNDTDQLIRDTACALSTEEHFGTDGGAASRCLICGRPPVEHRTSKTYYYHEEDGKTQRMEPADPDWVNSND